MDYLFLYFFSLVIFFSIIGYGFLLSRIIDKNLLSINLGYQGLLGIFTLTLISYITIFFTKHDYVHNVILHSIGIFSFIYHFRNEKKLNRLKKLISVFTILFVGLLIIVNHDDFNYYHLTYSLGLTENKLMFGLGIFSHGYKHHSSIFFFNSIIYLPFIKYYLFHSIGWFTLVFVNYLIIDFLLFNKVKSLNFEYFFYLLALLFINIKFCRIGGYGTDLSGQIILLTIFPLIYSTLKLKINDKKFKTNLSVIIILISYATTLKVFFILNFILLLSFLIFFNSKKIIKYIIFSKTFIIASTTISLLFLINIAYTGCAVYPVKETCMDEKLSWSLNKKEVSQMNKWYEQWAKAGAGTTYRVKNPSDYIKNFNWVPNWYETYFLYKVKELLISLFVLFFLFSLVFIGPNKAKPDKKNRNILITLFILTTILFFEWFYNHPALRYGGYHLVVIMLFIPFAYFLSLKKINFNNKKKFIIGLIIFSFFIFHLRNYKRISDEFLRVKDHNFPLFFAPTQPSKEINVSNDIKVYIPSGKYAQSGCWVAKTPCVPGVANISAKKKFGFKIFYKN